MKSPSLALVATLGLFAALPAAAYDFGLSLTDDSTYSYQTLSSLQQINHSLLWFSSPLGPNADLYVSGFYEFKGIYSGDAANVVPWRLDLGRAELSGSAPALFGPSSTFRYSVGRIETGDYSKLVLTGLSDGALLEADSGNTTFYLTGGYRGLLDKEDAYSLIDARDVAIYADPNQYFAPSRAFAGLGARFAELLEKHTFGVEAFGQFDLADSSSKVHTQYLEPYIEGRLGGRFAWQAWYVAELGESPDLFFASAAGGMVRLDLPEAANFKLTGTTWWASGATGSLSAFSPIREAPIDATNFFTLTDLLKAKLDASIMPLGDLVVDLGVAGYFRNSAIDPENQGALRADAVYFRGIEASAGASGKLSSELSADLTGGVFFPNDLTAYPSGTPPRWMTELYVDFDL
jgi:hypothetical protein